MAEPESVPSETPAEKEAGGSDTLVAILIAVTTLIGATLTWRSSVAGDAAGDADYAGLRSVVDSEETRARSAVNAYEHYSAFTSFDRQDELARLMEKEGSSDASETKVRAKANRGLFEAKFATRDGTYAVNREISAAWADAAREKDLNPEPQFEEADKMRSKSLGLMGAVTIVAIALVFFTLVEALGARFLYLNVGLGIACLVAGSALGLYYELLVR
jgi:hypothetical protein